MSKLTKRMIIFSVFTVVVLALMIYYVDPREFYLALKGFPPLIAVIYLLILSVSYFLRSFRWKVLLSTTGFDVNTKFTWRALHAAWFVNWITPLRIGEMVRLYSAKKNKNVSYGANSAAIAIEHIFDLIALLVIACISLILTLQSSQVPTSTYFTLILALLFFILLIALTFFLIFFGKKVAHIAKPISQELYEKLLYLHSSFRRGIKVASRKPGKLITMALLSFVIWSVESSILYLLTLGLNVNSPFSITVLGASIGFLTFSVPILPGSIGTYETIFAAILTIAGIPPRTALHVPLLDRVLKSIYMVGLGLPLLLKEGINLTKLEEIEEEVEDYIEEEEEKLVQENSVEE